MSSLENLKQVVKDGVEAFRTNRMCQLVDQNQFTLDHYHSLLLMIFHQTFHGPSTFALSSAHCDPRYYEVRDYLMHHADEEKNHWEWVISDLKTTGYTGSDPRQIFPRTACQSYVSFNIYVSLKHPVARLAIAAMLESIGASC